MSLGLVVFLSGCNSSTQELCEGRLQLMKVEFSNSLMALNDEIKAREVGAGRALASVEGDESGEKQIPLSASEQAKWLEWSEDTLTEVQQDWSKLKDSPAHADSARRVGEIANALVNFHGAVEREDAAGMKTLLVQIESETAKINCK